MTIEEKNIQIALGTYLPIVWAERCKLYDEGNKLWDEGHKLYAEGNKLWVDAVVEVYGKDIIEWDDNGCKVDGVEYRYEQ